MASSLYLLRKNQQWTRYDDVLEVDITDLTVQSGDYRDTAGTPITVDAATGPGLSPVLNPSGGYPVTNTGEPNGAVVTPATVTALEVQNAQVFQPDDVVHYPLRQSPLEKSHWRFDRGASFAPRYLYATWQEGDIISDNPPETAKASN